MKKQIDPKEYLKEIVTALPKGMLLTTKDGNQVDTMIIGWGAYGVEWGKETFTAYVRKSRYTHRLLSKTGEFTVNIPLDKIDPSIVKVAGSVSGRDMDKIAELGLTLEEGEKVNVPAIKELPLTLECKVLFAQEQELSNIPENIVKTMYPLEDTPIGKIQDTHTQFIGEVVAAYIVE